MAPSVARKPPSAPRHRPWRARELLGSAPALRAPEALAERLRISLWDDLTSEYDARFLSAHVRALDPPPSEEFLALETRWARDEANHHVGFALAYDRLFGLDARRDELEARVPDFAPLAHLFADELGVCVLMAYDELSTVRAFRRNLWLYDAAGPALGRFVRRVIADEAQHYAVFLHLLRTRHPHRAAEARDRLQAVRDSEGTPYRCTFVLDHDGDAVWDASICDEAAAVLDRRLVEVGG